MADFVLTRPYFLLLLLLPLLMKFIRFSGRYRNQTFVKQEIIDYFADERVRRKKKLRVLFLIPWIIGCIALSGPTLVDREHRSTGAARPGSGPSISRTPCSPMT